MLGSSNGCSHLKRLLPSPGLLEYSKCPGLLLLGGRIGCVRVGVEEPPYCSRWAESSILRGRQHGTALSLGRFASGPQTSSFASFSRAWSPLLVATARHSPAATVRCAADTALKAAELKCQVLACMAASKFKSLQTRERPALVNTVER